MLDLDLFSILMVMLLVGGLGHFPGAIIGAFLVTFLSFEWLHFFEEFEVIVYGFILLVVTIFLPHGLVGLPHMIKNWLRR